MWENYADKGHGVVLALNIEEMGRMPFTGATLPSRPSSPMTRIPSRISSGMKPRAVTMPRAIGRS